MFNWIKNLFTPKEPDVIRFIGTLEIKIKITHRNPLNDYHYNYKILFFENKTTGERYIEFDDTKITKETYYLPDYIVERRAYRFLVKPFECAWIYENVLPYQKSTWNWSSETVKDEYLKASIS